MLGIRRTSANVLGYNRTSRQNHRSSRRRLLLEPLEERALLSTWTVNSLGDAGTGSGQSGDLRYCITQANKTTGDNTIKISVTGTITLNSALPPLSNTTGLTEIAGPGAESLTVARSGDPGTPDFCILNIWPSVQASLTGVTITGGSVGEQGGGGIENGGTLTIANSAILRNTAGTFGGGVANWGSMTVTNATIAGNSVGSAGFGKGAGIANEWDLTVINCSLTDNVVTGASGGGGAIMDGGRQMRVINSTIAYNSAPMGGGILEVNSFGGTITGCTIAHNSAFAGGAIALTESRGIYVTQFAMSNSTIASNTATWLGGGIYADGVVKAVNTTIAYNAVAENSGGGLYCHEGANFSTLFNSIVVLNTASGRPDDVGGDGLSSGSAYNLLGVGCWNLDGVNGNHVGVADPGLDPRGLQDHGGPTQTIALVTGSPAIDAGSESLAVDPRTGQPLTTDQRDTYFRRIFGASVDIGAFELQPSEHLLVTAQPPASLTAGSVFGLTVSAYDQSGSLDTSFQGTVTLAIASNPGGSVLGGTLTATAQNGVITFSDLTLNRSGIGYTVLVSSGGAVAATTDAFDVTPAAASQLVVTTQPPAGVVAGSGFGLVISAEDPFGNVDTNFVGSVGVGLATNPGGAILGGVVSATAQSGKAVFSDLTLDQLGAGYTLQLSSSGVLGATTSPFNVQTSIASSVGVNWGTARSATLDTNADGLRLLPSGRHTDLPWTGINRLQVTLAQAANLAAGDITVHGVSGINYGVDSVSGSGTSYTITLSQRINGPDRVTLKIGNALIASFTRRIDVLPGDFNDDGVVNSQDMVGIRNEIIGYAGAVWTIFGDINGDGLVDINDYTAVRNRIGMHL
jgi:hypothetical protein